MKVATRGMTGSTSVSYAVIGIIGTVRAIVTLILDKFSQNIYSFPQILILTVSKGRGNGLSSISASIL